MVEHLNSFSANSTGNCDVLFHWPQMLLSYTIITKKYCQISRVKISDTSYTVEHFLCHVERARGLISLWQVCWAIKFILSSEPKDVRCQVFQTDKVWLNELQTRQGKCYKLLCCASKRVNLVVIFAFSWNNVTLVCGNIQKRQRNPLFFYLKRALIWI